MNDDSGAAHTVRQEISAVIAFVALIWGMYLLDLVLPIDRLGLVPRTLAGLPGIVAMPLVHRDAAHVFSNTVPLVVLLTLLAGSRSKSWAVVAAIAILGGTLLWLCGRSARHVGASGLVFGLITFLIASGLLERRPIAMVVSVIVAVLYGTTLAWNVLPHTSGVSWDGHLCGAIAGIAVAYGLARNRSRQAELPTR